MSDNGSKSITSKSDVGNKEECVKNSWVIGVSTSHPGQKYYFNTVTGVSVWNISSEDMDRAQQHMRLKGSQSQYVNCPEPVGPPPNRRVATKQPNVLNSKHTPQGLILHKRQKINKLSQKTSGVAHQACSSPVNQIFLNSCLYPYPECIFLQKVMPQSQFPMSSTYTTLNTLAFEMNKFQNLSESHRLLNKEDNGMIIEDICNGETLIDESDSNDESFENSSNNAMLNLEPLKCFAKSSTIEDKWYIIADADVYLYNKNFLKLMINSDQQCSLIVPQNVKFELENATKTNLKTKAYCANYFIHKLVDSGVAVFDEDPLDPNDNKSNKEYLLDCCSKLNAQNHYVVLITNDTELIKYRHKVFIPIFMVRELKDFLCRQNDCLTNKSSESSLNMPHNIKHRETTPHLVNDTQLPDEDNTASTNVILNQNGNIGSSFDCHDIRTSMDIADSSKITADAAVQTEISLAHIEKMELFYNSMYLNAQKEDNTKEKATMLCNCKSAELLSHNNILSKPMKLRWRRIYKEPISNDLVKPSRAHSDTCNVVDKCIPDNNNLSENVENRKMDSSDTESTKHECENNKKTVHNKTNDNPNHTLKRKIKEDTILEISNKKLHLESAVNLKRNSNTTTSNKRNENNEYKNVMFEINTEKMRETLRTRCDEWVSRFVQIMEEALTHTLRKNLTSHLPPPLNVYEATECIEKKFKDDIDVADACARLLNVFSHVSDEKGNINLYINPPTFMEMYSFGVYLIDALQAILTSCEDLQIAAESLSKLLNDIQEPEKDQSNLESHHDTSQEDCISNDGNIVTNDIELLMDTEHPPKIEEKLATNNDETINMEWQSNKSDEDKHRCLYINKIDSEKTTLTNEGQTACIVSPNTYRLRSLSWKRTIENEEAKKHLSKDDDNFKHVSGKNVISHSLGICESLSSDQTKPNVIEYIPDDMNNQKNATSDNLRTNEDRRNQLNSAVSNLLERKTPDNEQRVIRNFVRCPEIDARLRNQQIVNLLANYNSEQEDTDSEYTDDDFWGDEIELKSKGPVNSNSDKRVNRENESSVTVYFKTFYNKIAREIKDVSSAVYAFSSNCIEQLESATYDKNHIQQKARQADIYLQNLFVALIGMFVRGRNLQHKLKGILDDTQFSDADMSTFEVEYYGKFVTKCLDHIQKLRPIIKDILSAVTD